MLHALRSSPGSRHRKKRVGRGNGSGRGNFSGRGCKGQLARSGSGGKRQAFEGGQTPFIRRQPKLGGFRSPTKERFEVINIGLLEKSLEPGSYDTASLVAAGLIDGKLPVKLLGSGTVKKKFALMVNGVTKSAKKAIEAAGGSVTVC